MATSYAATVAKIGETEYDSLRAAVTAAESGATITLVADDKVSFSAEAPEVVVDKALTIDGGSNTLYGVNGYFPGAAGDHDLYISGSGDVTIKNLRLSEFGGAARVNLRTYPIWVGKGYTGTLTLENVTVDAFNRTALNFNGGTVVVKDCAVTGSYDEREGQEGYFQSGINVFNAKVTVSGTTIEKVGSTFPQEDSSIASAIQLDNNGDGTVAILDGSYSGQYSVIVAEKAAGSVAISGGDFKDELLVEEGSTGKIVVYGGTFDAPVALAYCADEYIPCADPCDADKYSVRENDALAAVANGYAWRYLVNDDNKTVTIFNYGRAAVSPAPIDAVEVPSKLDGKNVTGIDSTAFTGCNELKAIVFKATAPLDVEGDAFEGVVEGCTAYVPKTSKKWPDGTWKGLAVVKGDYKATITVSVAEDQDKYGSVKGSGAYAIGKNATLKATPAKDYVFAGWYKDGVRVARSASYAYTVIGENAEFVAEFVALTKDAATGIELNIDDEFEIDPDVTVAIDIGNMVDSYSEPKLTVKGLPSGLKYDAKTMTITGKTSKPGIYTVQVSATNASVKKATDDTTTEFTLVVHNYTDENIDVAGGYGPYIPGVVIEPLTIAEAEGCTVSGLPAGMKWTKKDIMKKGSKTEVDVPANSIYGAATKPGYYTVYFTKTVKEPNEKGKLVNVKHTATAVFTVGPFPVLTVEMEGNTGKDKVTGAGAYAANKKVSLKATAEKGKVFNGWYDGATLLSQNPSYSYIMPDTDTTLTAKFIAVGDDNAEMSIADFPAATPTESGSAAAKVPCGVYLEWPVDVDAESLPTVKVAGLPTGLKFTAKDIVDSKTKEVTVPANTIYGTPTAASKKNKSGEVTPSKVKVTVTTAGKKTVTYTIALTVDAMQPWAVGTFNGGGDLGQATLTVASNGKISGKYLADGLTWTVTATSFDSFENGTYAAIVTLKAGKDVLSGLLEITEAGAVLSDEEGNDIAELCLATNWKSDTWKTVAANFAKKPASPYEFNDQDAVENPGTITLKFAATGAITTKGVFTVNGKAYSASGSSVLIPTTEPDETGNFSAEAYVYFPPKKDAKGNVTFAGYSELIQLDWDGEKFARK